jgi:hypothetical protein
MPVVLHRPSTMSETGDTSVNVNAEGQQKRAARPDEGADHSQGANAVPHVHHHKIILGLMVATIVMVCLWLIMFWAPESNDESYQTSVVAYSVYVILSFSTYILCVCVIRYAKVVIDVCIIVVILPQH